MEHVTHENVPARISGGMCQPVMIAMALLCPRPKLLIADEPTTALDVTVQAQIMTRSNETEAGIEHRHHLLITHDLAWWRGFVNRVLVMYAGPAPWNMAMLAMLDQPVHPYSIGSPTRCCVLMRKV
ncbi:ATP-binding cassette domain-containing protein [Shigella flexneri]